MVKNILVGKVSTQWHGASKRDSQSAYFIKTDRNFFDRCTRVKIIEWIPEQGALFTRQQEGVTYLCSAIVPVLDGPL